MHFLGLCIDYTLLNLRYGRARGSPAAIGLVRTNYEHSADASNHTLENRVPYRYLPGHGTGTRRFFFQEHGII